MIGEGVRLLEHQIQHIMLHVYLIVNVYAQLLLHSFKE